MEATVHGNSHEITLRQYYGRVGQETTFAMLEEGQNTSQIASGTITGLRRLA